MRKALVISLAIMAIAIPMISIACVICECLLSSPLPIMAAWTDTWGIRYPEISAGLGALIILAGTAMLYKSRA